MPVHGFTVTPVVSLPQLKVMDLQCRGSGFSIARSTGARASSPIPALVPAQTERPAVFVELCPINWEATVAGMRYVTEAKVNLHVVTDWLGSSAANSDQREESLTVFDLLEKIHTALADVDGEHFREFDISNSTTNHNHEDILENIETYSYVGYRELDQSK